MSVRAAIYTRTTLYAPRTSPELLDELRQAIENQGGYVVATYVDDTTAIRRGRPHNPRWKALLASLRDIDQVAIASAGDVPGRTLKDLLIVIACLRERGVSIYLHREGVDTRNASPFVLLDIVDAYRRASGGRLSRGLSTRLSYLASTSGGHPSHPTSGIESANAWRMATASGAPPRSSGLRPPVSSTFAARSQPMLKCRQSRRRPYAHQSRVGCGPFRSFGRELNLPRLRSRVRHPLTSRERNRDPFTGMTKRKITVNARPNCGVAPCGTGRRWPRQLHRNRRQRAARRHCNCETSCCRRRSREAETATCRGATAQQRHSPAPADRTASCAYLVARDGVAVSRLTTLP